MAGLYSIMVGVALLASGAVDESTNESNESAPEKIAVAELKKLGAILVRPRIVNRENEDGEKDQRVWCVMIDQRWTGGDEGLKHLEQLPNLSTLYITGRPKISEERLAKLTKTLPDLSIQYRTNVVLGITTMAGGVDGCNISKVLPGTPAAKAGLLAGDLITQFDGKPLKDSADLFKSLSPKEPGDEVTLTVLRNGMSITVKVKLGKWPGGA